MNEYDQEWRRELAEYSKMKDACIPRIKELKLKGLSYKEITEILVKDHPNLTVSYVSKWGLRELGNMSRYTKNDDGSLSVKGYDIFVSADVMKLLEEARERLRVDLGRTYLPSYSETIKDFINKC